MAYTPVDVNRFGDLIVDFVEPDARDGVQRTTREGVSRWRVHCLRQRDGHTIALLSVIVASASMPSLVPGFRAHVENLVAIDWADGDRHGLSYRADSITTVDNGFDDDTDLA